MSTILKTMSLLGTSVSWTFTSRFICLLTTFANKITKSDASSVKYISDKIICFCSTFNCFTLVSNQKVWCMHKIVCIVLKIRYGFLRWLPQIVFQDEESPMSWCPNWRVLNDIIKKVRMSKWKSGNVGVISVFKKKVAEWVVLRQTVSSLTIGNFPCLIFFLIETDTHNCPVKVRRRTNSAFPPVFQRKARVRRKELSQKGKTRRGAMYTFNFDVFCCR